MAIVNSDALNIGVHVSFQIMLFSGCVPRSRIAVSYGGSILSVLRNLPTVLHSGCANLHFHPQWRRVEREWVLTFEGEKGHRAASIGKTPGTEKTWCKGIVGVSGGSGTRSPLTAKLLVFWSCLHWSVARSPTLQIIWGSKRPAENQRASEHSGPVGLFAKIKHSASLRGITSPAFVLPWIGWFKKDPGNQIKE